MQKKLHALNVPKPQGVFAKCCSAQLARCHILCNEFCQKTRNIMYFGKAKLDWADEPKRSDFHFRERWHAGIDMRRTQNMMKPSFRIGDAGGVLRTIADASNYMLALPHEQSEFCARWRHAATLILEHADVAAVSRQVHLAQVDIKAM
jgi:hypothetical protein